MGTNLHSEIIPPGPKEKKDESEGGSASFGFRPPTELHAKAPARPQRQFRWSSYLSELRSG